MDFVKSLCVAKSFTHYHLSVCCGTPNREISLVMGLVSGPCQYNLPNRIMISMFFMMPRMYEYLLPTIEATNPPSFEQSYDKGVIPTIAKHTLPLDPLHLRGLITSHLMFNWYEFPI